MNSKLSDICFFVKDKIKLDKNQNQEKITLNNYISTENLLPNKGGKTTAAKLPETSSINKFSKNDILISNIRPYFKKIWFADIEGGCSTDTLIFRAEKNVDPSFLYYILSSEDFFDYATLTSKGTKMPRGDKTAIMNFAVPDFSLEEQTKIGKILSKIDGKIGINLKINKNLETIGNELFKRLFVHFEFPDENGLPYKSNGGEMVDSELGEIPADWEVKSIEEATDIVTDYVANGSFASLKKNVTYKIEQDYAILIRLVDFNRGFSGDFVYVDEHAYNFLKKSKLFGGEIIISNVGANVGTVFRAPYLKKPTTLGPNAIMIRSDRYENLLYYHFISSIGQHSLKSITTGSAHPKFNKTDFRRLKVIIPPLEVIDYFNHIVSRLNKKIIVNKHQNDKLSQTRDLLLPKLMSGEIDVSEVEI